ncbi:MAG: MgtC/SapB family protein [Candidatus Omnitrophica bacterium]|nr:MgtC/SapB family protein [Candidatus Omnitrophota bacterium]
MNLITIVLRLFIAILCGIIIGLEREFRDKAAGLRTHILVCLGAAIFGILGLVLVSEYKNADILRLAQGLLIGIGFLGGGVIFKEGASVKGLTTAAGIWVMGAIGLAVGVGSYYIAFVGTIFTFLVMALFGKFEKLVKK